MSDNRLADPKGAPWFILYGGNGRTVDHYGYVGRTTDAGVARAHLEKVSAYETWSVDVVGRYLLHKARSAQEFDSILEHHFDRA